MIELLVGAQPGGGLSSGDLAGWVEQLAGMDVRVADGERIDRIRELERVKSACAAAQAVLTVAFVASQTAGLSTKRARDERVRRSVSGQVAVARCESPFRGGRHVGLAAVLTSEMPNVLAALRSGVISEWRATLVVRETACLSLADRQRVDKELAGRLGGLSDRGTAQAAARIGQRLDPGMYVARAAKAAKDRRVSCRPAPDLMTYVTALVPVAWGVAVYAALVKHAAGATAAGDPRSRAQVMADEFVSRITAPDPAAAAVAGLATRTATGASAGGTAGVGSGFAGGSSGQDRESNPDQDQDQDQDQDPDPDPDLDLEADPAGATAVGVIPPGVGLDIGLVMTDRTLFDGDNEPAFLTGYGPIPAPLARRLVAGASPTIRSWIRRLYTDPGTGQLIDADSKRRVFSHAARQFLIARDQTCRGPFCDAPIRHADHIQSHDNGGPTRIANGQGLCERCNHTKEEPGWHSEVDEHGITITTPTGHTARSEPPMPPRSTPWAEDRPIEYWPFEHRQVEFRPDERKLPHHLTAHTPFERSLLTLLRTG